ncbi:hypothetical protein I4P11_09200 [Enterobacter hormaechei]|uniref:DUF6246 family protein n=1 Tax=Enterobacter hormaechei TaxID=158836 RepID=UPI0018C20963|nr:DUF6246 family protein [Enterobacter hormaechei]MBG0672967.1 hypothetical protein [Enterobacter hormaechei]HDS5274938.1 hypothetical protein [Enterobacter hormaechei subsp. steigerwaltii]
MTPVKEFGECLISVGDKDYFFRPSFLAISSIGDPVEIVQTFYDLYNDEAAKLIKKAAESYIHSEYDSLPEYVIHYIKSGILSRKAIMAAHAVLSACCEDDVGDLIGWMKPSKSRKRGFMWRQGIMSPQEMVIIAQSLMMHGVIGKGNLRKLQRHESNEPTNEFRVSDYIIAARNHFNISKEEAAQLTMTEFQMMLVAKYPEQNGYTRDEYDSAADDYFARRKRRLARENQK